MLLESSVYSHPSTVINERLQDEQIMLKAQAYTDYLKDLTKGMAHCLFDEYFIDWNELRIIREFKEKNKTRRDSN